MRTRSEKELWEAVLIRESFFSIGLCDWTWTLALEYYFNPEEYSILRVSMKKNLPIAKVKGFCWTKGLIEPRIEWIKERIKQLENEPKIG